MRVLVACEYSGTVRDAFIRAGHYAASCDLLPSDSPLGDHYQCSVLDILDHDWDLMIAHPPCTYLSNAGAVHLYPKKVLNQDRLKQGLEAKEFFMQLLSSPIEKIAIENPVPSKIFGLPQYHQVIQPYEFGHPFQNPALNAFWPTCHSHHFGSIRLRLHGEKPRWPSGKPWLPR